MDNQPIEKFEILRLLAVAGADGEDLNQASQAALAMAAQYVGLNAAAIYLWDDKQQVSATVTHADSDQARQRLAGLEESLFADLRKDRHLISAYLSFAGEPPYHSFTQPLRQGTQVFGAIIGLQEGKKTIIAEDVFLETLSALLALVHAARTSPGAGISQEVLDKERLSTILETAVTVNHEINNPLTAILGNVQLLMLKRDDLDDELKAKLKTIETSAMKIRDVTQRLMRMTSPKTIDYSDGTRMVDISDDEQPDNGES
ncbi:MAG TPA: histidine kinase dimerization/phospho-acceptor domain-containing protein [candidate division Zixibacteria bacterium]|nr:histidine kinase dimerization/phospho-acceptor domain-containing protein [candidate division Zixibacteria bacterium]